FRERVRVKGTSTTTAGAEGCLIVLTLSICLLSDLSESVLQSMQRSRRLLFVLSPDFLADKSFSLLECRLGLYLQHGHRASIVALVLRSVSKLPCVEAAQVRQAAVSTVSWRGARSEPLQSRFWLRLRLTLPVRPLALGRRLIDSTSSHSDLAALALQRAQQIHIQRDKANQNRKSKRASGKLKCQDQQVLLRDRDRLKRGATGRREGPQHIRSCPGCTGFVGQVEPSGAELTVETELQQAMDRTRIRPKVVPNTEPPPETGTHSDPDILHPNPDPNNPGEQNQQQQMTGSRTEYNGRQQEEEELGDA
ncbi:uncharacterized protein LOC129605044, partial [Betta splendens]|uniref:Uncharacterized protein LOC129605044 n=1 Tax=Betta splendens TaxID=158456 RepID=A0A9W2Y7X5_BETSP